jgi:hypothetical protein
MQLDRVLNSLEAPIHQVIRQVKLVPQRLEKPVAVNLQGVRRERPLLVKLHLIQGKRPVLAQKRPNQTMHRLAREKLLVKVVLRRAPMALRVVKRVLLELGQKLAMTVVATLPMTQVVRMPLAVKERTVKKQVGQRPKTLRRQRPNLPLRPVSRQRLHLQ